MAYQELLKELTIVEKMIEVCHRSNRIMELKYTERKSQIIAKLNTYPYELATPRVRQLSEPFTHARVKKLHSGWAIFATNFSGEIALADNCRTLESAIEYINA